MTDIEILKECRDDLAKAIKTGAKTNKMVIKATRMALKYIEKYNPQTEEGRVLMQMNMMIREAGFVVKYFFNNGSVSFKVDKARGSQLMN